MRRALEELEPTAYLTGRRASQGDARAGMTVLESRQQHLRINPVAFWSDVDIWAHIRREAVPYNPLHDQAYKSVGDWHSTEKTPEGGNERSGRWKGTGQTECGMHQDLSQIFTKKFQGASKASTAQQLSGLTKKVADPVRQAASSGAGTSSPPQRAHTSPSLDQTSSVPTTRPAPAPTQTSNVSSAGRLCASKEDEDDACIKARVAAWQEGKNLPTMLVSLHEVTPASAGWMPVPNFSFANPDKHASGKSGERMHGNFVFEVLHGIYRTSV